MAKQVIRDVIPDGIRHQIKQRIRDGSKNGETGWKNAPTSEDTLTGDWGGAMKTAWSERIEDSGFFWRWRIQYRKLGAGNQHASEEKSTGSDGVFQIEVRRFSVGVLPATSTTVSLENVIEEYLFAKGLLFQSKRSDSHDADKLLEEVQKIEKLTPGNGVYFEYGPTNYHAAFAQKIVDSKGSTKGVQLFRLGDFLADHFMECLVGVEGLYVDLDSNKQVLHFPEENEAVRSLPTRLGHALAVQITAFRLVRFEKE